MKTRISHFTIAILITILSGLIYVTVQQSYRSGANDPQLQLAKDISYKLDQDKSIETLLPNDSIEISKSLSPFVVLYDNDGNPIRSTATLDGQIPKLPKGVFDFTRKNKEDVLSWQPRRGVRMAMVIESVQSPNISFVAAGRSLEEVEKRESNLTTMVMIAWLVCIAVIVLNGIIGSFSKKNF